LAGSNRREVRAAAAAGVRDDSGLRRAVVWPSQWVILFLGFISLSIERLAHGNLNLGFFFFFLNRMNLINGLVQTIGLNQVLLFGLILLLWLLFELIFFFFVIWAFYFWVNELGLLGSECS
jgi:hypothetical protein